MAGMSLLPSPARFLTLVSRFDLITVLSQFHNILCYTAAFLTERNGHYRRRRQRHRSHRPHTRHEEGVSPEYTDLIPYSTAVSQPPLKTVMPIPNTKPIRNLPAGIKNQREEPTGYAAWTLAESHGARSSTCRSRAVLHFITALSILLLGEQKRLYRVCSLFSHRFGFTTMATAERKCSLVREPGVRDHPLYRYSIPLLRWFRSMLQ